MSELQYSLQSLRYTSLEVGDQYNLKTHEQKASILLSKNSCTKAIMFWRCSSREKGSRQFHKLFFYLDHWISRSHEKPVERPTDLLTRLLGLW